MNCKRCCLHVHEFNMTLCSLRRGKRARPRGQQSHESNVSLLSAEYLGTVAFEYMRCTKADVLRVWYHDLSIEVARRDLMLRDVERTSSEPSPTRASDNASVTL